MELGTNGLALRADRLSPNSVFQSAGERIEEAGPAADPSHGHVPQADTGAERVSLSLFCGCLPLMPLLLLLP